jgi:hypothetical protein
LTKRNGDGIIGGIDLVLDNNSIGIVFSMGLGVKGLPADIHIGETGTKTNEIWLSR